ncbi:hypothetical protein BCR32DRAFT_281524 [Anaeromyces robustus]|uniref:Uncharacterized protein n=1 Tax=Anaeromyces robustus TaxID=1754192 RepID=A0A1Y1X0E3_9FUNG|nr:hypothetical protein BCR32DRAFT_281524 [Anaeromyces robustus]|eukprot:ORX79289.1 hypothetical protein BCR32DRAFT_281524 [Anaeromyces robustus]
MDTEKEKTINSIFFRRKHKFFIDNNKDINQYYKLQLEKAIEDDKYIKSSSYLVTIKKCQLLYCVLTINNELDLEFENGKLLDNNNITDKKLLNKLRKIVELET